MKGRTQRFTPTKNLQGSLGRKRTDKPLTQGSPLPHRPSQGFKYGLNNMVGIVTMQEIDMQGDSGMLGQGPQELADKGGVKGTYLLISDGHVVMEKGAVGKIKTDSGQGFIHRHIGMGITMNTGFIAQGLGKGLAKADADIFHSMMVIDMGIALCLHREVKKTMHSKESQHMVQESNAGADIGLPRAVNVQLKGNLCF